MLAHLENDTSNGVRILEEGTMRQMHERQYSFHPELVGMTFGFMEEIHHGRRALTHEGFMAGFFGLRRPAASHGARGRREPVLVVDVVLETSRLPLLTGARLPSDDTSARHAARWLARRTGSTRASSSSGTSALAMRAALRGLLVAKQFSGRRS
jgi:hypothetical protein